MVWDYNCFTKNEHLGEVHLDLSLLEPGTKTQNLYPIYKKSIIAGYLHLAIFFQTPLYPIVREISGETMYFPAAHVCKPGDIFLFAHNSFTGRSIRKLCNSQYSHAALITEVNNPVNGQKTLVTMETTSEPIVDFLTGETRSDVILSCELQKRIREYHGVIWHLSLERNLEEQEEKMMMEFVMEAHREKVPYDYVQGFLRVFGKHDITDLKRMFCSEFAAEALKRAGQLPAHLASSNYWPKDLYGMAIFRQARIIKYLVSMDNVLE